MWHDYGVCDISMVEFLQPPPKAYYWVCLLEWIRKLRDKLLFCADVKSPVLSLSSGNCRARVLLPSALSRIIGEYTLEETLSAHVSCCKVLTSNLKQNYQLLSLWAPRFGFSTWSTDHTLVHHGAGATQRRPWPSWDNNGYLPLIMALWKKGPHVNYG